MAWLGSRTTRKQSWTFGRSGRVGPGIILQEDREKPGLFLFYFSLFLPFDFQEDRMTRPVDVVVLKSSHSSQTCRFWWKIKGGTEDDVLYGTFRTAEPSPDLCLRAATQAATSKTKAVEISENGNITETSWVDPLGPPFEAPPHIRRIPRDELAVIQQIHPGVDIVEYGGTKYVHKYMTVRSHAAHSFEFEITNYGKTVGSPYLLKLHYIVTYKDVNRGLLIEYASSKSLAHVRLTPSEIYSIIVLLLDALCDLEARGYYPQDLKLPNILVSDDKRLLHIVDLGSGLTEGMYRLESERSVLRGKMTGRDMCYTFGKTVSHLYYDENDDVPPVETLPSLIRRIVVECCGNDLEPDIRMEDVRRKYCAVLEKQGVESVGT